MLQLITNLHSAFVLAEPIITNTGHWTINPNSESGIWAGERAEKALQHRLLARKTVIVHPSLY